MPAKTFAELRRAAAVPQTYVATMTKTKRTGKIFTDYFRNDYTAAHMQDVARRMAEVYRMSGLTQIA